MAAATRLEAGSGPADAPVAASPVLLWTAGRALERGWLGSGWTAHTGWPLERLRGEGWLEAVHADDVERCRGIIAASVEAGRPYALDYRLRHRAGGYRWVLDNGAPHDSVGDGEGYAGAAIDIDARKASEDELAQRMQSLRLTDRRQVAFLSTLPHALRNPLAPIANAASVLRTLESEQPTLKRLREILERQVERIGRLADDLAHTTRALQGQVSLVREDVTIAAVVHGALEATAEVVARHGHEIRLELPEEPLGLRADPARLSEALAQLIDNAARHSPEPGILEVAVRHVDGRVEIAVVDHGRGISPAFLPHVFEPFAQEDEGRAQRTSGAGVGLALARRIAHLHGGDITAASNGHGQGARFTLEVPVGDRPSAAAAPWTAPPDRYRVLVVAADPGVRAELGAEMERWGNDVRSAADAPDALRQVAAFAPQIVLCDVGGRSLPDPSPLRARLPGGRAVLAAVSEPGDGADEARVLAEGWDAFLLRPLESAALAPLLRAAAAVRA